MLRIPFLRPTGPRAPSLWVLLPLAGLLACSAKPDLPAPDAWIVSSKIRVAGGSQPFQGGVLFASGGRYRLQAPETIVPSEVPGQRADLVTLGFIDAHAHPVGLGRLLTELDLVGLPSYRSTLEAVKGAPTAEGWLIGRGWDQNDWPDTPAGGWPLATDLDALTGERPTALRRVDGHATWANSAALRSANITADTPDPPGGRIIRDASGAPTGVLVDTASDLLSLPEPTIEQTEAWLLAAQTAMHQHGLVGVHDMGVDDTTLAAYRSLREAGTLNIRVSAYLAPDGKGAEELLRRGPSQQGKLGIVGIKAYADGALGSRGAYLSTPYADDPSTRGLPITSRDALAELAERCLKVRAQLAIHAIGDQAVTDTLDAFAIAREAVPEAASVPLRIEHAQIVKPDDIARFKALNVIASVQPTHATSDMPWAADRLGEDRVAWGYTWRAFEQAGVQLALGSDFPVEDVAPALGLHAAVRRTDLSGQPEGGWQSEQALRIDEAIDGFTVGASRALGQASPSLETGAADLTLWTHHDQAPQWRASAVIIDGVQVWP